MNQLILGDCLEVMRKIDNESIDLIYLDPPFFSNRNYEVIWGDKGEIRSFEDRWSGGMNQYILWLKERVIQMHRILKPTGSIYLHCDWHADAYIRIHILDKLFGKNNFRNQIIWEYTGPSAPGQRQFSRKHDMIYWYSKSDNWIFNKDLVRIPYVRTEGVGNIKSGKWGKFDKDLIDGKIPEDYWYFPIAPFIKSERIGYPTQKPEKLMERIILASTNEGDTILDPFVGGGTTIAVANKLKRIWLGIDQSAQAIKVSEFRLYKQQNMFSLPFTIQLHKYDYDKLFNQDAFEFEKWIIEMFKGIPQGKKGGDKGIDGKTREGSPIQVKQSENIGVNVIKNFYVSAKQFDSMLFEKNKKNNLPIGYIIAFSFGKGAIDEAARLQNEEGIIIKLVNVDSLVPISKKPPIKIETKDLGIDGKGLKLIEFKAKNGDNLAFFSWDFNYNEETKNFMPEIIRDTIGTQQHSFEPGNHTIAIKAIDNEGLETIELIRLKINGIIEINLPKEPVSLTFRNIQIL